MQRSEALWGPDAHEFKPERWLDLKAAASYNANFMFLPFNAGPRIVSNYFPYSVSDVIALLKTDFFFLFVSASDKTLRTTKRRSCLLYFCLVSILRARRNTNLKDHCL
jgi:hypothetical protein